MHRPTADRRQRGLTLVELLVALVMGLVLLAGVVTVFVANKETYRVQEAVARGQENGRFALAVLARELRATGHWGCNSLKAAAPPLNRVTTPASSQLSRFDRPIYAFHIAANGSWGPDSGGKDPAFNSLPTSGPPIPLINDSDVLIVRVVDDPENPVDNHDSPTADIVVRGASNLQANDTAIVSDCEAAAIFRVTGAASSGTGAATRTTLSHGQDLGKQYPSAGLAADVQRVRNVAYFVGTGVNGRPALFRWDGINAAEELVEGVERLEVRFGVDTSNPPDDAADAYVESASMPTSNSDSRWDRILSVRVTLVVSSDEQGVTAGGQSYVVDINDTTSDVLQAGSTDTRLRQVYSTTVAVRNKQS